MEDPGGPVQQSSPVQHRCDKLAYSVQCSIHNAEGNSQAYSFQLSMISTQQSNDQLWHSLAQNTKKHALAIISDVIFCADVC